MHVWIRGRMLAVAAVLVLYLAAVLLLSVITLYQPPGTDTHLQQPNKVTHTHYYTSVHMKTLSVNAKLASHSYIMT